MSTTNGAVAPPDEGFRLYFDLDAERAVLGGLMACSEEDDEPKIVDALAHINREDFHRVEHRRTFDAITELRERGMHFGPSPVTTVLEEKKQLDGSFNDFDVRQMLTQAPKPLLPVEPAKRVHDLGRLRALVTWHQRIGKTLEIAHDPESAFEHIEQTLGQYRPPGQLAGGRIDGGTLLLKQFPTRVPGVQYFFDLGKSYLIAGGPKAGKSVFVLQCAISMAAGQLALGALTTGEPRDVLYFCLDDGEQRTQARLRAILAGMSIACPPTLLFQFRMNRMDEGGLHEVKQWAEEHPRGFIFIDLLENIRPVKSTGSVYRDDYAALSPLSLIAHDTGCGIAVVHHTRKPNKDSDGGSPLEDVSGSNGLTGAVDGGIIFGRRRPDLPRTAPVAVNSRDDGLETYDLEWSEILEGWRFIGASAPVSASGKGLSSERKVALDAVRTPRKLKDWATTSGLDYGALRRLARKMLRDGQVRQYSDGAYIHAAEAGRVDYPYPLTGDDEIEIEDDPDE